MGEESEIITEAMRTAEKVGRIGGTINALREEVKYLRNLLEVKLMERMNLTLMERMDLTSRLLSAADHMSIKESLIPKGKIAIDIKDGDACPECGDPVGNAPGIGLVCGNDDCSINDGPFYEDAVLISRNALKCLMMGVSNYLRDPSPVRKDYLERVAERADKSVVIIKE